MAQFREQRSVASGEQQQLTNDTARAAALPTRTTRVWQKLALVLVAVGVVPLFIAAYVIADNDANRLAASARAYHLAIAEVAIGEVRGLVARSLAEARALGQILARSDTPGERRESLARAQLLAAELVDGVAVYDPSGERIMVLRTSNSATGLPWTPPEALSEAARATALKSYGATEHIVAGRALLELTVAAWTEGATTPYAFLAVVVDLAPLSGLVKGLALRHFDDPRRVRLLDAQLRVVAAAPEASELGVSLRGAPATAGIAAADAAPFSRDIAYTVDYGDDDAAVIGALVPLPELGWAALVEESQAEAYAGVAATWRTAALVGLIVAVLSIVLALIVGRRMARPIEAMAQATSRVAGGDFEVRVAVRGRDEIAATGTAFNAMAKGLGDYRTRLVDETRARENLSRFLSPEVVERIVKGREALTLGGERREITVMFADVVGFTTLADEREPEVAVAILNELFTIVTEIVFQHGGVIDKFIGDCAMAIWGAPTTHADDAARAVRAAESILRWLEVGNAKWRKQIGRDIQLAIGIHTGPAVVGNIGSEKRMEYTAIGDAVNIAARLERLARPGQILMTRETMQRVGDEFVSQSIGTYDLVGRARPSEIFVLAE